MNMCVHVHVEIGVHAEWWYNTYSSRGWEGPRVCVVHVGMQVCKEVCVSHWCVLVHNTH